MEDAPNSNWLRAVPVEGFFIILRLSGDRREYCEGICKPSDLSKIHQSERIRKTNRDSYRDNRSPG